MIGNKWDELLADEWQKPYYQQLRSFLIEEYKNETVYPPAADIFNALRYTDYDDVKVVILGQDPYHEQGQAHGLAFSVPVGVAEPPSLVNILKEMESDIGPGAASGHAGPPASNAAAAARDSGASETYGARTAAQDSGASETYGARTAARDSGDPDAAAQGGILEPWARRGVLLLNTVLTVRAHQAGSHRGRGWEQFTDRVIELLASREKPMVFILWGASAGAKKDLIMDAARASAEAAGADITEDLAGAASADGRFPALRHLILTAPHPSPLSAYRGFFGGAYFSRSNWFLEDNGMEPVDWTL